MPRIARAVAPGVPHHITQRGNNHQEIFFCENDRKKYLQLLSVNAARYSVKIWAYCLMNNHVHLVAVPGQIDSLAKTFGKTHSSYAKHINKVHGYSGHLWQNRFLSCAMDNAYCIAAMCYVELNPVRSGLVKKPWQYGWSSCTAHISEKDQSGILDLKNDLLNKVGPEKWKILLDNGNGDILVRNLRSYTRVGRPLGSDRFISKIEARLGRGLRSSPIGRPRNNVRNT
jgi:putative transposase